MRVRNLYISKAHCFLGHHGREPGEQQIVEVAQIECVAGRGIRGDRYFDHKPDYKGQITFVELELYRELSERLGVWDQTPATFRRNVVTEGQDLNRWIGVEFEIQGVRFLGMEECRPCYWMDRVFGAGAERAMRGRGGLRAKILSDGVVTAENAG